MLLTPWLERHKKGKDKKKGKTKRQKEKTQVEEPNPRAKLISTQAASLSIKFRSLKQNDLLKVFSFSTLNQFVAKLLKLVNSLKEANSSHWKGKLI